MSVPLWYPPASKVQPKDGTAGSKNLTGITMAKITKVLLHSTESTAWPSYPTFAPTLTYDPWHHQWRQHMPINRSATTLQDPASTHVRENRDDIVQVEIVGYCDPATAKKYGHSVEALDAQAIADLGAFLAWMHTNWQVPLTSIPEAHPVCVPAENLCTQHLTPKSTVKPKPAPTQKAMSDSEEEAVGKAEDYLNFTHFSKTGLIKQLEYEKFSQKDSTYAVNHITVNWNKQATGKAKDYSNTMHFSHSGLVSQLKYDGFTHSQAEYGADHH